MKKTVIVSCPIFSRSGYGQHSRLIVKELLKNEEYDVKILPTLWGTTPQTGLDNLFSPHIIRNIPYKPDIWIQISIPNEFQAIGEYNIGITAGTESSVCSLDFIEGCNRMNLVITPSQFTKKILTETIIERRDKHTNSIVDSIKTTTPIEVLFEGVDADVFSKKHTNSNSDIYKLVSNIKEDFCFLVVGTWLSGVFGEDRKNIGLSVKLFVDAFRRKGGNNRPALILKTSGAGFSEIEKYEIQSKINQILQSFGKVSLPKIYLLWGDLSDSEMNDLYNHPKIKAMYSLTHAEGYGLPLSEFTTTGKPTIAPMYSGHLDFLSKDHGALLLPGQMVKIHPSAANQWLIRDSEWFSVNYNFAIQLINDVFEKYDKYLSHSKKHQSYTFDNYSLSAMGIELNNILKRYVSTSTKPQIIKLPKLNISK